jgi:hypothetical protein
MVILLGSITEAGSMSHQNGIEIRSAFDDPRRTSALVHERAAML